MSVRLDWLLIGTFVGFSICLNSCSAVSTLIGFSSLCLPFALISCFLLLTLSDADKNNTALTIGALVFTIPVLLSAIGNFSSSNVMNSLTLMVCILLAYLCVRKVGPLHLCHIFVWLMCATSCVSLLVWIATNWLGINLPFPVFENVNGVHYKTIFIVSQFAEAYIDASKSMGFSGKAVFLLLIYSLRFPLSSLLIKKHQKLDWPCWS